ncbi:MAG TPA: FAD-binding oxidoreductase [Acidimicrobiales bacterium]|jgi:FAD/FMN-containing dehydrogenase|nr:FAD-binding oxidoreductase [Acidimicrobiales bacterium]
MDSLTDALADIVGSSHVLVDPDVRAPFETDWTRRFSGPSVAVVRPASTEEVSRVLALCSATATPVVVQGGNTGLVGGGVPGSGGGGAPVILVTTRLTGLAEVDPASSQVTAGAGVTLGRLQEHAAASGLVFPVDLAARDTATVGGMVATNAGGLHVIRYGGMRAQVVGLEAVLADGTVVSRLSGLVKDNTGYDLSQLLVGSEGTLGVITAARLRLVAEHPARVVALLGLPSTDSALAVLDAVRRGAEGLQAAEVFYADGLALVREHGRLPAPVAGEWPVYLLIECAGRADPTEPLFAVLAALMDDPAVGLSDDATAVASNPAAMARLWEYRERHTEAVSALGVPHKLDVTLPQSRLAAFESSVRAVIDRVAPGSKLVLFGHIGDGNLHVNVVGPPPEDETLDEAVLELVASMDGSISAEHGIGRAKAQWLHLSRSPAELAVMKAVKGAIDPSGILNPGVLFA